MDYRTHLQHPLSLRFIDKLVDEVFLFPTDFPIVYQLIFDSDDKVSWRAAWACQKISEKHPEWFFVQHFLGLAKLSISTRHGGLQRGCLSILNNLPFPDPIPVDLINACFDWMTSAKSSIAVQALSMKVLVRICKVEPDFVHELIACLENVDYESYSPGFKSIRKNALKVLKNS